MDGPIGVLRVPAEVAGDVKGATARVAKAVAVVPVRPVTEAPEGMA